MGHPNSKKHKAMHGGYKKKHSQRDVNALCGLYQAIADIVLPEAQIPEGTQLSIEFPTSNI